MKFRKSTVSVALMLVFSAAISAQDTIRIMTLNIHQGSDTTLQAIGEYIKQYNPDLVALQELDQWPHRPEAPKQTGKNFIAELSYYSDMIGCFGKAWDHPKGWDYGDGILSKYPIERYETLILPYNKLIKGSEPRQILISHINIKGHKICFASTHLCHMNKNNREKQIKVIYSIMSRQSEKIIFVCGDLNSDPSENIVFPNMRGWQDALTDEKTFPSNGHPYAKYDYILYKKYKKIEVVNSFLTCDEGITDHCGCIVDIILK